MPTPHERVRRLVQTGTVAPDEGERLIAAMSNVRAAPRTSVGGAMLRLLFNPFDRFGGETAAIAGAVISVLSLAVTRLGVRFDGALDLHVNPGHAPPLHVSAIEQGIAWLLPAACFFLYARLFSRHVRIIDFVGAIGLARWPLLVASVPICYLSPTLAADIAAANGGAPKLGALSLIIVMMSLFFVAINITLLYQGFKNAAGLRGPKLIVGFIVLLIGSEIMSKLALMALH